MVGEISTYPIIGFALVKVTFGGAVVETLILIPAARGRAEEGCTSLCIVAVLRLGSRVVADAWLSVGVEVADNGR
jgi:hypothetical protein